MSLRHYGPDHEWEVVQREAQHFWNSPWAMVSQWRLGATQEVLVYENDDDIVVNINLEGLALSDLSLDIDDSHLHLTISDKAADVGEKKLVVPFPFHVDPDTADAVALTSQEILEIKVRRQVSPDTKRKRS